MAGMPGKCCGEGHLHEGTPKGEITTFAGVESYVSPSATGSTSKVLFYLTDIIGHKLINAQLLADCFAAHGYHVVMPDLFRGDPWLMDASVRPPTLTLQQWLQSHQLSQVEPVVLNVLGGIKTELKPDKIVAVGYCFGAKYVTRLLAKDIDVGFVAHPSLIELEELANIKAPLAIAAAETDNIFTTEQRHEVEAELKKMGATYQINLYGGVEHGFAVRGDMSRRWMKRAKEQAFAMAIEWFQFHLDE